MDAKKSINFMVSGLDYVIYAMNTSYCRVTKYTPYELVFGQKPRANINLLKDMPVDTVTDEDDINLEFEEPTYPMEEENGNSTGESGTEIIKVRNTQSYDVKKYYDKSIDFIMLT